MDTSSHYDELSHGDPLPERDEVSRYCSPNRVSHKDCDPDTHERCEPRVGAFQIGVKELDLSLGRIQYFCTDDRDLALAGIRREFQAINYTLKPKGRFVIFNVGQAIQALMDKGCDVTIKYTPQKLQPSHSSMYGLPGEDRRRRLETATALKRLITQADIYPSLL